MLGQREYHYFSVQAHNSHYEVSITLIWSNKGECMLSPVWVEYHSVTKVNERTVVRPVYADLWVIQRDSNR